MEPVTTGQIYWGAMPFVIIQVIMVGLVIAFPGMVMHYKGAGTGVDPSTIQNLDLPQMEGLPPLDLGPAAACRGSRRRASRAPCRGWSPRPAAGPGAAAGPAGPAAGPGATARAAATGQLGAREKGRRRRPLPASGLAAAADREAVEAVLGHLPPQEAVVAERPQRIVAPS